MHLRKVPYCANAENLTTSPLRARMVYWVPVSAGASDIRSVSLMKMSIRTLRSALGNGWNWTSIVIEVSGSLFSVLSPLGECLAADAMPMPTAMIAARTRIPPDLVLVAKVFHDSVLLGPFVVTTRSSIRCHL